MESICKAIGNTPLVRIDCRYAGAPACIYAKLESYNLTGSIKDRMAAYVLEHARARGTLRPGQPIVEVTSGNTGISLAAIGGSLGHPVHIFMPDWVSHERRDLMDMYGAVLHMVSREAGGFAEALRRADAFAKETGAFRPDQFNNPDNALAHYCGTGAELLRDLPAIDGFAAGVGSGGTLMGVARRLKEGRFPVPENAAAGADPDGMRTEAVRRLKEGRLPENAAAAVIAAVEPAQAPMLSEGRVYGPHRIEGIGDDFIPALIQRSLIDRVFTVTDADAVGMARMLARELGLGVGISSGANFLGALRLREAYDLHAVATVFPDDNKKYLSTVLRTGAQDEAGLAGLELIGCERING